MQIIISSNYWSTHSYWFCKVRHQSDSSKNLVHYLYYLIMVFSNKYYLLKHFSTLVFTYIKTILILNNLFLMFQSFNKYKFHFRSLFVFITSIACYYSVSIHLYLNISPHWIWSLYLSPIFVVCVFLFCLFYINIAN